MARVGVFKGVGLGLCYGLAISGLAAGFALNQNRPAGKTSPESKVKPVAAVKSAAPATKSIDFNRDIRPILSKHCLPCHGNDKEILQSTGNMRLDTFDGATQDRGGYKAIWPGHPEKSRLIDRIEADESFQMPPKGSTIDPLSKPQIALIKQWIREGAEYRGHWAFERPTMPSLPKVRNGTWARNPVDRFVLAQLEAEGLTQEPEADRRTLIRRVTLALTGLPPTPVEIQEFLNDKRPDAYERLVDRLLESLRYGENQARYWLDAVRYADTHGLHIDNERAVFPYRDWVVRALNEDLSFDKFTIWQLAGDLLPNPTLDQMVATGYVRMNPTTAEGGVIEAEFLAKNTYDRVDTTSTIFLGLTMGCAKCHDHKYDPVTIKDYYSLYAFFNSTQDPVLDGNLKLHQPVMKAPSKEQSAQISILEAALRKREAQVSIDEAARWLESNASETPSVGKWEFTNQHKASSFDEAFDKDFGPEPGGAETTVAWKAFDYKLDQIRESLVGADNAAAYFRVELESKSGGTQGLRLGSDDGIKVWLNDQLVHSNKILRPLAPNQDTVAVTLKPGKNALLIKIVQSGGGDGLYVGIGDANSKRLVAALSLAKKTDRKPLETREIQAAFLELGPATPLAMAYRETLAAYRKLDAEIPFTYIAKEMPKPRPTFVLKRGAYDNPGEKVDRNIPKFLGSWIPGRPKNRLGLAQWIVDRRNPLTSRVIVNRIWQQHFGQGLVRSDEDFGSRGEWPSHPELLDYLAVRFMNEGWSLKKLHRLLLTSASYRQASSASAAKRRKDPENRLVSRGPRFRLDAEVVRDQGLYLSGLLVEDGGGRGDKPYQPPGLWEIIAYPISDTARYVQDHGKALYRKSLYLFWKRTSPPPTMLIFDAPMRESCVTRRTRTNTPTQALVTLNETGFVEAARVMAQKLIVSKPTPALRIDYAFRLATGRPPSSKEAGILSVLYHDRLRHFQAHHSEAHKLLEVGEYPADPSLDASELAAWTLVCNAILNLDEVLTLH